MADCFNVDSMLAVCFSLVLFIVILKVGFLPVRFTCFCIFIFTFGMLPLPVGLFKLLPDFVYIINAQGRDFNFGDFRDCKFKIGRYLDAYEQRIYMT